MDDEEASKARLKCVAKFLLDGNVQWPIVIKSCAKHWPCSKWTLNNLSDSLRQQLIKIRLGYKNKAQFEGECKYEMATLRDVMEWCNKYGETTPPLTDKSDDDNPLMKYDPAIYWCYADYKYMVELFSKNRDMLKDVCWSDLGFEGCDGTSSTIWIGSEGANTPCHYDTYGCNLVLQVVGKKKWQLFPPHQSECLYPTRIPFEESSVFSEVSIVNPDLKRHLLFRAATPYTVTLQPGDILFVPHHWWHYVESLETSVSINCWMDLVVDDECRLQEAITRTVFCKFFDCNNDDEDNDAVGWLNPTETVTSTDVNMQYINKALEVVKQTASKRTSNKDLFEGTPDDPAMEASSGDSCSREFHVGVIGKRKRVQDDDALEVKTKRLASTNEQCISFFKEIGITAEIVPRHERKSEEVNEQETDPSDIESTSQDHSGDVDMRTLLQCITHPRIVSEISKLLLERTEATAHI